MGFAKNAAVGRLGLTALAAALLLAATGCTIIDGGKIDYRSTKPGTALDVPPDLTKLANDPRYQVTGQTVSATGLQALQQSGPGAPTALSQAGDVKLERIGQQRYLTVARSPEQLWGLARDFFAENGLTLVRDQQNIGVMETEWAENRAKIPNDGIRRFLGSLAEGFYATGERDKFRLRMERVGNGTEIFMSHRGMIEVARGGQLGSSASTPVNSWQPRDADAELESEMLRRLMVKLGMPADKATPQVVAAASPIAATSRLVGTGAQTVVEVDDAFDRAWRRIGLSLDRTGFTVEDRDRNNGIYFVRYAPPGEPGKEPGFFAKLFSGGGDGPQPVKYRVTVKTEGNKTTARILDGQGQAASAADVERIAKLLQADLK
jgi:outer membrane protein assembly factor BamC